MTPRRLAAIDIGTNSVKLSVLEFLTNRPPLSLVERVVVTRLGEGVLRDGVLRPRAVRRTMRVVRSFRRIARAYSAPLVLIATEALRRARTQVSRFGAVRILSRRREAELSFLGARAFLRGAGDVMVDIGGGTIELLVVSRGRLARSATLPLGCVFLTERFMRHDPPTPAELTRLETHVARRLGRFPLPRSRTLVGIGGSVATVAYTLSSARRFDTEKFNGARIPTPRLERLYKLCSRVDARTRTRRYRVDSKRADVILAAMAVLRHLAARTGARQVVVCTYGVRHGALLEEARRLC